MPLPGKRAPGAPKAPGELSTMDRLRIFTVALKHPEAAMALKQQMTVEPQRRAFMDELGQRVQGSPASVSQARIAGQDGADITDGFAPQYDMTPARAPLSMNSPELPALALKAQQLGVPLNSLLEVMKAQAPDIAFERGFGYNKKNGEMTGAFVPDLGEGRGFDGEQVRTLPGYADSVGEIAGAQTGAQERAKAQFDVISINMPDGSTQQVPRDVAVQLIMQNLAGGQGGGMGAAPAAPGMGGLGRSQNSADKLKAEAGAQRQVDRPVVMARMRSMDHLTDIALKNIDGALAKISPVSAGMIGGYTAGIPGTPAADLKATLDSIGGSISVDQLQTMRANNTTGGALGNVTERELDLLSSLLSAIRNTQSPDQLVKNLSSIRDELRAVKTLRTQAFGETYGAEQPQAPARQSGGPRTTGFRSRIISAQ